MRKPLFVLVISAGEVGFESAADMYQLRVPTEIVKKTERAQHLRLSNKPEAARLLLEPIAESNHGYFLVHYSLGLTYAAQGDWSSAIKELKYAKQINVDEKLSEPTIYNTLGWSYFQAGSYDSALAEFTLAQQPGTFDKLDSKAQRKVLINTGLTYAYLGQPDKAMEFYAKARVAQPGQSNVQQQPGAQPAGTGPAQNPKGAVAIEHAGEKKREGAKDGS